MGGPTTHFLYLRIGTASHSSGSAWLPRFGTNVRYRPSIVGRGSETKHIAAFNIRLNLCLDSGVVSNSLKNETPCTGRTFVYARTARTGHSTDELSGIVITLPLPTWSVLEKRIDSGQNIVSLYPLPNHSYYFQDKTTELKGKFPQTTMWIGWVESNFTNPTEILLEQIWIIHFRELIMQSLYVALSRRNYARICDITREQLSIDFVHIILQFVFCLGYQ